MLPVLLLFSMLVWAADGERPDGTLDHTMYRAGLAVAVSGLAPHLSAWYSAAPSWTVQVELNPYLPAGTKMPVVPNVGTPSTLELQAGVLRQLSENGADGYGAGIMFGTAWRPYGPTIFNADVQLRTRAIFHPGFFVGGKFELGGHYEAKDGIGVWTLNKRFGAEVGWAFSKGPAPTRMLDPIVERGIDIDPKVTRGVTRVSGVLIGVPVVVTGALLVAACRGFGPCYSGNHLARIGSVMMVGGVVIIVVPFVATSPRKTGSGR